MAGNYLTLHITQNSFYFLLKERIETVLMEQQKKLLKSKSSCVP